MSEWTISLEVFCCKCKQKITQQDINQNNYQFIILPVLTFQHQVCPYSSPSLPQYVFNHPQSDLNLNLNLK